MDGKRIYEDFLDIYELVETDSYLKNRAFPPGCSHVEMTHKLDFFDLDMNDSFCTEYYDSPALLNENIGPENAEYVYHHFGYQYNKNFLSPNNKT